MTSPTIVSARVIPIAGHDSMLLNLAGAHEPFFTRTVVVLEDSEGRSGVGEVPGGQRIIDAIDLAFQDVLNQPVVQYKRILRQVTDRVSGTDAKDIFWTFERTAIHAVTAIETALLDLYGKEVGLPVAELLADGKQRDSVWTLGYLFFVGDSNQTTMDYRREDGSDDPWYRIRRREALTPEAIVAQAEAVQEKYGFQDFKLKGGVLPGEQEVELSLIHI